MGLDIQTIARQGAQLGFELADPVMRDAALNIRPGAGTVEDYDAETDLPPEEPTTTRYNVRGLLYQSFSQKNAVDSAITASFLVRVEELELQGLTETPNDADNLVIDDVQWNVVRVDPDPANAVYIFQIRRA